MILKKDNLWHNKKIDQVKGLNVKLSNIFLIIFTFVLLGCQARRYDLMQTNTPVEIKRYSSANYEYKIQPHDRLMITSYKFPDLLPQAMNQRGILVDSSGSISLPLIHRVHIAGLTQTQAANKLERLYRKYLKNPSINVESINKRVYVLGEVKKPGVVNLDREQASLLEVLAYSGDLTDNALRDNIIILSKDSTGRLYMRRVDLTNFNRMRLTDMMLHDGDIVYVKPNRWKKYRVQTDNIDSIVGIVSKLATPYLLFR